MNFQLAKYSLLKKFSENIGFTTPEEYGAIFKYLIENVKTDRQIIYSPHCHDDLGIAVANSLAAVKNGAGRVEETINGIRERAGNAALEEIAVALNIRQDYYQVETSIVLTETINTSEMVSRFPGIPVPKNKAVVGGNTFSHESGIHQDGVLKNPLTYENITPELVGVKIPLGKLSGRHAFVGKRKVYPDFYDRERKIVLDAKYKKLELTEKGINREDLFQLISYSYILKAEKAGLIFPSMEQSVNSEIGKVAGYGAQLKKWSIRIPQNASFYSTFCKMMENSEENFKAIIDEEVGRK
ncbi:2-isopropylmalate synthase [Streptococcus pneumoniae]|nr:2-isopropylmalate synthase [Streptococcus pneumoniae]CIO11853.1 2-isopropylmalate synthase [Streptococcus pneumoniae]CIS44407.1 2-isopropylmalate synthase [Streptococcus pneumoniae]CIW41549.1 2-isopropylmalate synthase [Streptococcus pneumoniae]CIW44529.1 2-isopropylmalate synthase [Streptococcus pneumoniae]